MKTPEQFQEDPQDRITDMPEKAYQALGLNNEQEILATFTLEQQTEIHRKMKILSSLGYFINKDFSVEVVLGIPTPDCQSGWRWYKRQDGRKFVQMNAYDLLDKPMDYLRFVTCHEFGHDKISKMDFIPLEVWKQKGFSFLMNAIEDPRDNNFVAANYPRFAEQMKSAYESNFEQERIAKEKAKDMLGFQPRFMQAGFEFIKLWFKERMKKKVEVSDDLSQEIKGVIDTTLKSATGAWRSYPTKDEADKGGLLPNGEKTDGDGMIGEYAKQAYEIILEEIWPEYSKLVEKDLEDQKMSELLKDFEQKGNKERSENGNGSDGKGESESDREGSKEGGGGKDDGDIPKELKDKLTPEEQKELEDAIEKAIDKANKDNGDMTKTGKGGEGDDSNKTKLDKKDSEGKGRGEEMDEENPGGSKTKPIDMDSLSPALKKKIKDFIDSLPEEKKKELAGKAEKALKDFEGEINSEIEGKLSENPEQKKIREDEMVRVAKIDENIEGGDDISANQSETNKDKEKDIQKQEKIRAESEKMLEKVRKNLEGTTDEYQEEMKRLAPQIKSLREKLAEIFQERRKRGVRTGFEEGEEIDVERRLQEKAKGISIFESKAWRRTELPKEKDYAISLLVDLSGSMSSGNKINEAFEATILFTEVLNSLGIKTEVTGFNDRLYEYQIFNERFSNDVRKKIITMKKQVELPGSEDNDDGWAVTETAKKLEARKEKEKLLLVISDGEPDNSPAHNKPEYELGSVVERIMKDGKIKIVGLGLGSSGVSAVKQYYPKHLLANSAEEMIGEIGDLLLEVIKG